MHLRRFSVTLATLMGFGLSAPVAAQQVEQAQASPDARTPKTGELVSEWQFKPRWRLQYDVANIDGPDGLSGLGSFQDVRRARVGVDLAMPHGFSARVETEFTANPIELTDLYLQWSGKNVKVILGQQKAQFPLDEENSNLNTSFLERAAFVSAFGYTRRTGISGHYVTGDWAISGGIYSDPLLRLNDVETNSSSFDVRTYWSPQLASTKLHFGAAYHLRHLNDFQLASTLYQSRPALRITETRYIGTPALAVAKEHRFGIEAAFVQGRLHFASEAHWLKAERDLLGDAKFFGAYAEVGVFLTQDSRPLRGGMFGAITPRKPVGAGGLGAVQLNLRYDYLDLNSGAIKGGKQNGYLASLIWTPAAPFRLMGQYTKLYYTDAVIAVAGNRAYSVDVVGVRGQMSF
jgi:phosphate-selective porin OprO/OprP